MHELMQSAMPKPGDIIVIRVSDASSRYALTTSAHVPQIVCATYEAAMVAAVRCAHARRLDVWSANDHHSSSRIVECRSIRED
jgi:hypothetical protein